MRNFICCVAIKEGMLLGFNQTGGGTVRHACSECRYGFREDESGMPVFADDDTVYNRRIVIRQYHTQTHRPARTNYGPSHEGAGRGPKVYKFAAQEGIRYGSNGYLNVMHL